MRVIPIPTLFDNYTYLVICEKTGKAAIVDSPDAEATIAVIEKEKVKPVAIFSTHHHMDHVGGNEALIAHFKNKIPSPYWGEGQGEGEIKVYGSIHDQNRIPGLTHPVKEGDEIKVGEVIFSILEIPGHTRGHIAYVTIIPSPIWGEGQGEGESAVFCGDTLFVGGCGRLFEGTPEQMVNSLTKLKNLPDETKIYCGHEYTQKNLEFALTLEPQNKSLREKYEKVVDLRKKSFSTIPTTIAEEKSYNPFLRWDSPELIGNVKKKVPGLKEDPVSVFTATRRLKDHY